MNRRNLLYLQTHRRMDVLAAAIGRIGPGGKDETPAKASFKVVRKKPKRG